MKKKKSISYTACEYDYYPDYEETYKGITFTVGLDVMGNMGLTIEFETEEELFKLLGIKTRSEMKAYNRRVSPKSVEFLESYFMPWDFDTFIDDKNEGNEALLLIRRPFISQKPPKCQQVITADRILYVKQKYKKSFTKFPDIWPNYMEQKKWVDDNPLTDKLKGLSDADIVDFISDFNKSVMCEHGITLFYLTIEDLALVCRNFIDDYISRDLCDIFD